MQLMQSEALTIKAGERKERGEVREVSKIISDQL